MAEGARGPDEAAFREDLEREDFVAGVLRSQWDAVEITWPSVLVWIAAATHPDAPDRFYFCLRCAGYPGRGPTGALWNPNTNAPLDQAAWPKGRARVAHVFRPNWEGGQSL